MNVFKKQRVRAQIMNIYYVYFNTFDASKICMYMHAEKIFARERMIEVTCYVVKIFWCISPPPPSPSYRGKKIFLCIMSR